MTIFSLRSPAIRAFPRQLYCLQAVNLQKLCPFSGICMPCKLHTLHHISCSHAIMLTPQTTPVTSTLASVIDRATASLSGEPVADVSTYTVGCSTQFPAKAIAQTQCHEKLSSSHLEFLIHFLDTPFFIFIANY